MIKIIRQIAAMTLLLIGVLAIPLSAQTDQFKVREIRERGYVVVGMTAKDQYPFYYTDSQGRFSGLDVDIAKQVAKRLEVDLVYNRDAQSFNDLIPLVLDEKIDFASSKLSRTLARAKLVLYTQPYIVFRQALLLNRLQLVKANISDSNLRSFLKTFNASVGVIKNSSYERYASLNFPKANIEGYDSWDDVVQAGKVGEVFTIYRDELEIFKIIKQDPSSNLVLKPVVLKDQLDPIAIAVHPEKHHFVFYLNRVLEDMNIDLNAQQLLEVYKE